MMAATGSKIWMDGRMVDFADAHVHVLSHTLHYGVGVFEGIRGYATPQGPAIFRLRDHVARLIQSARLYHMKIPYSAEAIERAILETQAANAVLPSYLRPIAY
ncbi:Aminotransferase, class IV, partial [mine drainage metagenome]